MAHLTEKRKADRIKMAALIEPIITATGATVERETWHLEMMPQCIMLSITADNGLELTVEFDGQSCQPDVYVLSWCVKCDSSACLSDVFQSVNNCHFQKATDVCYGFEDLCDTLQDRLEAAADGSAFSIERETEYARKKANGELLYQQIAKYQAANPDHALLP